LIEHSIIKISTILALGFGEAGAEILSSSVKTNYEADFTLTRGRKKYAVFGFCDIRNFTDVTEVLQEDVMLFVNNVASIVHSLVDRFNGAANKNVGDAFLLVWRFSELQNMFMADEYDQEFPESNKKITRIADLALLSFFKIIAKLNKSPKLCQYREHPKLRERIKNYKVKLGFGIHIGWAIEGAIGSSYKIDISYIGHHVNVSSTLETCTKAYGVQILISEYFYKFLSEKMKVLCRLVDNIVLKVKKFLI
jgi:class 3 adenylate cyclase